MAISPYPIDPQLTGLAIAYRNEMYIADMIAPYRPVSKRLFEWDEFTFGEMYSIPDTRVGRLSAPNQITFSASRETDSTEDFALDSPVPQEDIDNADSNYNPQAIATEGVMELIKLDREKRVADKTFASATYLAGLRTTLSGTSQWSDKANSNPITAIRTAMDLCLMRPNKMVMGQAVWTQLSTHPVILNAISISGTSQGIASREAVASLFEIPAANLIVGQGYANTAKEGQTVSLARLWGKHFSMFYDNGAAQLRGVTSAPTFMLTARFGTPVSGTIDDPDIGMKGGKRVRAGESVKELVQSNLSAYLFTNAVA
ncbi:hypothetical protein AB3R30_19795 [Leptolyngbyaceae cyanobacterium UHCC 1019]